MKNIFYLSAFAILIACNTEKDSNTNEYKLVWSDEFDYQGLPDSTKWGYDIWPPGTVNEELQNYVAGREKNARIEDGKLIIEAHRDFYQGEEYSSARLVTKDIAYWLYGRFEVRAKLPEGIGTWPAIWMLPNIWTYGGWPESGEIDIMEHVGYEQNIVHGTIHAKSYFWKEETQKSNQITLDSVSHNFYTYGLEWSPDTLSIFVDDSVYFTFTNEHKTWREWPFDKPFSFILNIAVGGVWGGKQGVDTSIWPQRMEIDYVRVYQKDPVPENIAPSNPDSLKITIKDERAILSWSPAYDNYSVKEYEVTIHDSVFTTLRHWVVVPDTKITTFKVKAIDWFNNESEQIGL